MQLKINPSASSLFRRIMPDISAYRLELVESKAVKVFLVISHTQVYGKNAFLRKIDMLIRQGVYAAEG